jgi:hypothetical protein
LELELARSWDRANQRLMLAVRTGLRRDAFQTHAT